MTLEKLCEMGLIKDDTEIWIRRSEGMHDPRMVAHGNWYQDHMLDYMQNAVKSFTWQDNNTLVIDIT